ncbi:MAG: hypothetical protein Q9219_006820 [cf. Caloplaca sp. 3 TL-2023]
MSSYAFAFILLWLWRYLRLIVNVVSAWTLKPIPPASSPRYNPQDVTVVLPTLGTDNRDFHRCLLSINACRPKAVLIITPKPDTVRRICRDLHLPHFEVIEYPHANKRAQMIRGFLRVETSIVVCADDDVFWPPTFLPYILAAFEDAAVGAAGPLVTLERPPQEDTTGNVWDFLSAAYLARWNFTLTATSHVDGGIACLSGRTHAMRARILTDERFLVAFAREEWFFGIPLAKADDDNFLTRWLVNDGWKIAVQVAPQAEVRTVLASDKGFVGQCIRWHRTTWRSNITSLFVERRVWRVQPWSVYALHLSTFNPPASVYELLLSYCLHRAYDDGDKPLAWLFPATRFSAFVLLMLWILVTKTVKLWPHFARYPGDLRFLPASIAFGYAYAFVNVYSLLTLHKTCWAGGRVGLTEVTEALGECGKVGLAEGMGNGGPVESMERSVKGKVD